MLRGGRGAAAALKDAAVAARPATKPQIGEAAGCSQHQGPAKNLFALGYAGWGPGQLEGELARHDWFTAPEEPKLVFDDDRDNLWEDAMARRTREL